jgi:methyl-accepting chemotaxis protein
VRFSDDILLGKAELEPSLAEYRNAREVFEQTLLTMKRGGSYPTNLKMTERRTIRPLPTRAAQDKIVEIEEAFDTFTGTVDGLLAASVGSKEYRLHRQNILVQSNRLRKLSDDLVNISTHIAESNQANIFWSVVIMGIVIIAMVLLAAVFLNRSVTTPLNRLSSTLVDVETSGDFSKRIEVTTDDEVGHSMTALNRLLSSVQTVLTDTNNTMQAVAAGDFTARIEAQYRGHLDQLRRNVNNQIGVLGEHIGRIDTISRFREIVQESNSAQDFGQHLVDELAATLPAEFGALYNP